MLTTTRKKEIYELARLVILCQNENHAVALKLDFKGFDKEKKGWFTPLKANYKCPQCEQEKKVCLSRQTYFNRFSQVLFL